MTSVIKAAAIKELKFPPIKVKDLFNTDPSVSISKIALSGANRKCKNTGSDTYYYILEGRGNFLVNGRKHTAKKGNIVCIPKNSIYKDSGRMKMLAISVPRFDPSKVEFLE